ncbi:sirohydrochlorin chelatase [Prochlorococcus sp. MIT 1300]|uniref:sirohydrochlorin chelatase n=1 Tax=Prochlorococcus sp. MIT 1300 TaxID=3096218 RepID=UPI002A766C5B|nr:sirohydrochlorin chelatase [Prochlorococcus sp. MIT 1300]
MVNPLNPELFGKNALDLGILVCGHGSRNRLAVEEFAQLVDGIRKVLPGIPVEYGYLEFARPTLKEGLDRLKSLSVNRVLAIPAMLFAAGHAKNDIPSTLNRYSAENGLTIEYGRELGICNHMIGAAGFRIEQALSPLNSMPLSETLLVVVGRGSSDPDANSNVSKITRMLVEGFGFGWGETVFSGVTFPLVEPGLRHLVKLGFKRIIVFPYFLFSGVLVSRIREHTKKVSAEFPMVEFVSASYLGNQPLVVKTFVERIIDTLEGNTAMNCALCKYRSQVLGFENEVGLVQRSHHSHVEGLDKTCDLCESECTGACDSFYTHDHDHGHTHTHDHDHIVYPHANHPLGPVSKHQSLEAKNKEN